MVLSGDFLNCYSFFFFGSLNYLRPWVQVGACGSCRGQWSNPPPCQLPCVYHVTSHLSVGDFLGCKNLEYLDHLGTRSQFEHSEFLGRSIKSGVSFFRK